MAVDVSTTWTVVLQNINNGATLAFAKVPAKDFMHASAFASAHLVKLDEWQILNINKEQTS